MAKTVNRNTKAYKRKLHSRAKTIFHKLYALEKRCGDLRIVNATSYTLQYMMDLEKELGIKI